MAGWRTATFDLFANLKRSSWRRQSQAQNKSGQNQQAQRQNSKDSQNQNQRNAQDANRSSTSTPTNNKPDNSPPPRKNPWNTQKQNKSSGTGGSVGAAAAATVAETHDVAVTAPAAQQQQDKPDAPAQPSPHVEQSLVDDFNAQEARERLKSKYQTLLSANGGKIERYQPAKEEGEVEKAKDGPWGSVAKRKNSRSELTERLTVFCSDEDRHPGEWAELLGGA